MQKSLASCYSLRAGIAASLLFVLAHAAARQPLSTAAAAIRTKVRDMPVGGAVTINMTNGDEYYGRIKSIESDSFSIHEVDRKTDLTLRYEDVNKVRKDFGRKNLYGKRIHPQRALITTLIVVGGLLTVVFVAVAADKS